MQNLDLFGCMDMRSWPDSLPTRDDHFTELGPLQDGLVVAGHPSERAAGDLAHWSAGAGASQGEEQRLPPLRRH
jgi:hypothetical protein